MVKPSVSKKLFDIDIIIFIQNMSKDTLFKVMISNRIWEENVKYKYRKNIGHIKEMHTTASPILKNLPSFVSLLNHINLGC